MKLLLPALVMLATISVTATAPMAHAVTFHSLTVTVTFNGQTSTGTFRVLDLNGNGMINVRVGSPVYDQILHAFGTTSFAFGPGGPYTGTFTVNGSTVTVELSSTEQFTLTFIQA